MIRFAFGLTVLSLCVPAAHADLVLDDFSTALAGLTASGVGSSNTLSASASVVGGIRDARVTVLNSSSGFPVPSGTLTIDSSSSPRFADFQSNSSADAIFALEYDGTSGFNTGPLPSAGLNLNLAGATGFSFSYITSSNFTVTIAVVDSTGTTNDSGTFNLPGVTNLTNAFLPISGFSGGGSIFNNSNIGGFRLTFSAGRDFDVTIANGILLVIPANGDVIPEPGTLVLAGVLGAVGVGLGLARRRRVA